VFQLEPLPPDAPILSSPLLGRPLTWPERNRGGGGLFTEVCDALLPDLEALEADRVRSR
jgi:hypothetical protein